jgi:hypothetical protein
MKRYLAASLSLVVPVFAMMCCNLRAADPSVEIELRDIKSKLPFLSLGDFLYHREPRDYTLDGKVKSSWSQLSRLDSLAAEIQDLEALTHHADADIRALALLGLVAKETPDVVPVALRMMHDKAVTLPEQNEPGGRIPGEHDVYTQPLTVAGIATKILQMMECKPALRMEVADAEAAEWWGLRKDNQDWLAWHEFLYKRASQGTTPIQPSAKAGIQRFRAKLDTLPAKTRAWVLLFLADDVFMSAGNWENYFATEEEMITSIKSLGADALLEFLRSGKRLGLSHPDLDDPENGRRFIVTYASQFFAKDHAETLLALKQFTAAADADPSSVRRFAEAGMSAFAGEYKEWDRAKVMAVLAALGDATDRKAAIQWFYDEPNKAGGSSPQSIFLGDLKRRKPERWKEIFEGLMAHSAFDLLQPIDVMYAAFTLEKLDGAVKLVGPGYRYEDHADSTRQELRRMFRVQQGAETTITLRSPNNFLAEPEWKLELGEQAHSLALSDDGKLLAVGFEREGVAARVISSEGAIIAEVPMSERYVKVAFTAVSSELTIAAGTTCKTWSAKRGSSSAIVSLSRSSPIPAPKSDRLALLDTDVIEWLELPGGRSIWKHIYRNRWPSAFQISPDAGTIACNDGWGKEIQLISTSGGTPLSTLTGHSTTVSRLAFSRDSKRLISAGEDNRLILWDLVASNPMAKFNGEALRFGPVAFSSDGQSFFALTQHRQLTRYSIPKAEPQFGIKFEGNWIAEALPSFDGKRLYILIQHTGAAGPSEAVSKSRLECWKLP